MEDVVRKMHQIPYYQSFHHEGEDVVQSLQEIPVIFLQEYGHRFGENIHFRLPCDQPLLVHLKVIEKATCSKVFFEQGWQNVVHAIGLERGDHIIIFFRAHLKFHMHVFDGTKGIKKENKVWGQKHKQPNAIPEKKIAPSLAFDRPHAQ
jgi:hypothetical protein